MKFYKVMAVLILSYDSKSWVMNKRNLRRTQTTGIMLLRSVKVYTGLDSIGYYELIKEELNTFSASDRIKQHRRHNWVDHFNSHKN